MGVAYRGLETRPRDSEKVSHVLQKDKIFFIFTSALQPAGKFPKKLVITSRSTETE